MPPVNRFLLGVVVAAWCVVVCVLLALGALSPTSSGLTAGAGAPWSGSGGGVGTIIVPTVDGSTLDGSTGGLAIVTPAGRLQAVPYSPATYGETPWIGVDGGLTFQSPANTPAMQQTDFFLAAEAGSDLANCLPATPCQTGAGGVVARWGTTQPQLSQTTTIHVTQSEALGQESLNLAPYINEGVQLQILCTAFDGGTLEAGTTTTLVRGSCDAGVCGQGAIAGNLTTITAKVSDLIDAGELWQNTSRGSFAYVDRVGPAAGPNVPVTLTEPMTAASYTTVKASGNVTHVADNDWQTNDTIYRLFPPNLNLNAIAPQGSQVSAAVTGPVVWVQFCHVPDVSGTPGTSVLNVAGGGTGVVFSGCSFDPEVVTLPGAAASVTFLGSRMASGASLSGPTIVYGGSCNTNGVTRCGTLGPDVTFDNDPIVTGLLVQSSYGAARVSSGYLVDLAQVDFGGFLIGGSAAGGSVWGPGSINLNGSNATASPANPANGTSWQSSFPLGAGLLIDGADAGSKLVKANALSGQGVVWQSGYSVSAPVLDDAGTLSNPATSSGWRNN